MEGACGCVGSSFALLCLKKANTLPHFPFSVRGVTPGSPKFSNVASLLATYIFVDFNTDPGNCLSSKKMES